MRPILFRWRGVAVYSYPALLYVGLVLGVFAGNAAAHASGLDPFRVFVATFLLIVPALLGARLLYVATHWDLYRHDVRRIWNRREGGAAQYGGLLLALPLSVIVLALLALPLGGFWDTGAFTILVGMIFARVGCLLNGCCSGRAATRWGIYLPNHLGRWQRRLPVQILEATWAALLLACAVALWPARPFPGAVFLCVVGGYGAGRLVLESLRERRSESSRFTIHHAISLIMILASAATLTVRWPRS